MKSFQKRAGESGSKRPVVAKRGSPVLSGAFTEAGSGAMDMAAQMSCTRSKLGVIP